MSSRSAGSLDQSSHGIVIDMTTPMIAPAVVRTARSSAGAPGPLGQRLARSPPIVRANSSRARARISGTVMVSAVVSREHVQVGLRCRRPGHLPDGGADRGERAQPGGLLLERRDHPGVHVVLQDDVFLGREVPEERARRHLGRRGDLLHAWWPGSPARGTAGARAPGWKHASWPSSARASPRWPVIGMSVTLPIVPAPGRFHRPRAKPRRPAGRAPVVPVRARRGRNASARMALASAMPPQTHSIASRPCTNALRAECEQRRRAQRARDAHARRPRRSWRRPRPPRAGRSASRWLRYTEPSTVPSTATPMVAPTWRIAEISAEPEPLRSARQRGQRRVHRLRHGQPQPQAERREPGRREPGAAGDRGGGARPRAPPP